MQPSPSGVRMPRAFLLIGLVCVLLICALLGGILLSWLQANNFFLALEPRCTLGVSGTAATLTIEAWSAPDDCQHITNGDENFLGKSFTLPGTFYRVTQSPNEPVLCELDIQNRHLIVHDQGILTIVGYALCHQLSQRQNQPNPVAPNNLSGSPNVVNISDQAGVLDVAQVRSAASTFPCRVDIYTVSSFSGDSAAFDQQAVNKTANLNSIVIAFNTNPGHVAIVGGNDVRLLTNQYTDAANAFANEMKSSGNYTNATIAALHSLQTTLDQVATGEEFNHGEHISLATD